MKINTLGLTLLLASIVALLFVPPVFAAQSVAALVALPDEAKALILALVTAGLSWLLLKVNMGEFTQPLAAVISPILIAVLERLTGTIPPFFDNLVLSIIHLFVLFISGSIGAFLFFKRFRQPKQLLQ